jgi:hypothetical protein
MRLAGIEITFRLVGWPWLVRRRRYDDAIAARDKALLKVTEQQRALARLGHARDQAYRDAAVVVKDLRVASFQILANRHAHDRIRIGFELQSEMLMHGWRRDGTFQQILCMQLEQVLLQSPEASSAIYGPRQLDPPN